MIVSKKSIVIFFSLIIMVMPGYFSGMIAGYKAIMNITSLCILIYLFINRAKPSRFTWCVIIFYVVTIISTWLNGNFDYHDAISSAKTVITLLMVENYLKKDFYKGLKVTGYVINLYVLIDILTVILFPEGIYTVETVWNEWGFTSYGARWILGTKNTHVIWYLLAITLAYLKYSYDKKLFSKLFLYILLMFCEISCVILESSTSAVVIIFVTVGILLAASHKWSNLSIMNVHIISVIYFVVVLLILAGETQLLAPIVKQVLGKDLTFSNRTYAWTQSIAQIIQKPILGWGIISSDEAREILGSMAYVNAHNQWLQTLWEGGIVLLGVLIVSIMTITNNINRVKNKNVKAVMIIALFSCLISMIFEVQLLSSVCWLLFLYIYHAASIYFDSQHRNETDTEDLLRY